MVNIKIGTWTTLPINNCQKYTHPRLTHTTERVIDSYIPEMSFELRPEDEFYGQSLPIST
jgi:hypothetical protein